ncbi:MAG: helix-turn-helix domain-containing protein [Bdellovibrio sp.]|nr:helix-turn-helix domain-containing protein [Bdellovibrio sp.]
MKNTATAFDYPIVIRQKLGFLTITVPDLNIVMAEEIPVTGKLEKHFLMKVARSIGLTWLKVDKQIKRKQAKLRKPSPTKSIMGPLFKNKPINTPEAAKILGVSENTLRRMVKRKQIQCMKTAKGHRRFSETALKNWIEKSKSQENPKN